MQQSSVKLIQDVSKKTGSPFTALKVEVGKWSTLIFPTQFERDYLVNYFADSKQATLSLNSDNTLQINAGDYSQRYKIQSVLEEKYVVNFLKSTDETPTTDSQNDATLDLSKEDELKENPFN